MNSQICGRVHVSEQLELVLLGIVKSCGILGMTVRVLVMPSWFVKLVGVMTV